MSFKPFTRSLVLSAVATVAFACSSSNKAGSGGTGGGPADGGGGVSTGGTAGKGGTGGSSGSAGSSQDAASCGDDALLLGDYWKQQPAACTACVHSKCCAEAEACTSDRECTGVRKCLGACGQYDSVCQNPCSALNLSSDDGGLHSGSLTNALNSCKLTKCETECNDLSCVGKPWPAPTTAHDVTIDATMTNFSGGVPMPGVTVKVCAHTDTTCATPLDQATTKSDGTIQLKAPAAAGGTDAYFEFSGSTIYPEMSYFHFAGGESVLAKTGFQVLDPKTAALFQKLAGGIPLADGGSPDAGMPYGAVSVLPRTCGNSVIVGATISSSNAGALAVTSYLVNGIPSTTATMTDQTDIGAIVNHAVGPTTVTVKLGTQTLGTANVMVRAGVLTTVIVQPGQSGP